MEIIKEDIYLETEEGSEEVKMYWQLHSMISKAGNVNNLEPGILEYEKIIKEIEEQKTSRKNRIDRDMKILNKQEEVVKLKKGLEQKLKDIRPKKDSLIYKDTQIKFIERQIELLLESKEGYKKEIMEKVVEKGRLSLEVGGLGKEVEILEEEIESKYEEMEVKDKKLNQLISENADSNTDSTGKTLIKLVQLLIHYHGENMMLKNSLILQETEEDWGEWDESSMDEEMSEEIDSGDVKVETKTKEEILPVKYEETPEVLIMGEHKRDEEEGYNQDTDDKIDLVTEVKDISKEKIHQKKKNKNKIDYGNEEINAYTLTSLCK